MKKILLPLLAITFLLSFCKKPSQSAQQQNPQTTAADTANPNPSDPGLSAAFASITPSKINALTTSIQASGYHVENSLPTGYVKDGSVDYTAQVQAALSQPNLNIIFPPFPILINDGGVTFQSNQKILFTSGAQLWLKASALQSYKMLYLLSVSNLTLINPVIVGDRDTHTGTGGEAGQGIDIKGCANIVIVAPNVTKCWGDGIYLSGTNSNVTISDANLTNNRRDDMSVISVNGLYLIRPYLAFAHGTAPECGIDLEPDAAADDLLNIHIVSPVTQQDSGKGISVGLKEVYEDPGNYPLKNMSITVYNHHDIRSTTAIELSYQKCVYTTETTVQGFVTFTNPIWEEGSGPSLIATICEPAMTSTLVNPQVIVNGTALTPAATKTLLLGEVGSGTLTITQ